MLSAAVKITEDIERHSCSQIEAQTSCEVWTKIDFIAWSVLLDQITANVSGLVRSMVQEDDL